MTELSIVGLLQESSFVIAIFGFFLLYAMLRGRHSLINLIFGLYFALLISLEFPYYDVLLGGAGDAKSRAFLMIVIFGFFTVASTYVLGRFLHEGVYDRGFTGIHRKIVYALAATVLVLTYSFHALPVTDLIDPGPIQTLFVGANTFFFWLFVPIIILFFL